MRDHDNLVVTKPEAEKSIARPARWRDEQEIRSTKRFDVGWCFQRTFLEALVLGRCKNSGAPLGLKGKVERERNAQRHIRDFVRSGCRDGLELALVFRGEQVLLRLPLVSVIGKVADTQRQIVSLQQREEL